MIPVTIPIVVATKRCKKKPTTGSEESTTLAATSNVTKYGVFPSKSKTTLGRCIVNAPMIEPTATKKTSFRREKLTLGESNRESIHHIF